MTGRLGIWEKEEMALDWKEWPWKFLRRGEMQSAFRLRTAPVAGGLESRSW